jgi:hypothetical protein
MANTPDGKYARRAWDNPIVAPAQAAYPPQAYIGPFASNQERLLSQSLAVNLMAGAEIQEYVRPPLPQIKLFPPRFGYMDEAYGIQDIVELSGRPEQVQRTNFGQTQNEINSTARNDLGTV